MQLALATDLNELFLIRSLSDFFACGLAFEVEVAANVLALASPLLEHQF